MKKKFYFLLVGASSFLFSCTTMLPLNNHYEKAGTLKKGNVELSGHLTRYDVHHYGRKERTHDNFGFRAGIGLTERFDLKLRYEKMQFTKNFDHRITRADYFSLVPKLALVPERLSLLIPVSTFRVQSVADNFHYTNRVSSIAPQLIYTYTNSRKTFDISFASKIDYLFELDDDSESNTFFGMTLGAGFSTDLSKWAIRPEIGLASELDDAKFISYGIGFQWILPTRKKK